jgi:Fusaric acid resistance protein family
MNRLSPPVAIFAFSRYLSVVVALFAAFALDLPNPWWAMVTVFLAQPTRPLVGAIWAKASYRVGGTVIGGVASIVFIPAIADTGEILILAVAAWVGLCLFGSLLDRSPRSYMFMLAGDTVALVGLPTALAPADLFDPGVGRRLADRCTRSQREPPMIVKSLPSVTPPRKASTALKSLAENGVGWRRIFARNLTPPKNRIC